MKRWVILLGVVALGAGCRYEYSFDANTSSGRAELEPGTAPVEEPAEPQTPPAASQPEVTTAPAEGPSDQAPAGDEPLIHGKPLDHWVAQATRPEGPDDLDEAVAALTEALQPGPSDVRVAAADALGEIGPPAVAASRELAAIFADPDAWVRVAAMGALAKIGPGAVPAVVEAFENNTGPVRIRAGLVLGNMGPDAAEAVPALEKAAAGQDPDLAERAEGILAQIVGEGAAAPESGAQPPAEVAAVEPADEAVAPLGEPGDWPQFHGPRRDNLCQETGLLDEWPEGGPPLAWKLEGLGRGYSTVSIAGGRLFTMGDRTPEGGDEAQFVMAFDLATREELWATRVGPPHKDGPRCTPTVDGDLVYVLGTSGDLLCVESATGEVRWRKSLPDDFGGQMMSIWKFSESPLVDGDRLVSTPGGPEAGLVALDKKTGEVIWKCAIPELGPAGKDGAAYTSMVVAVIDGVRQYVQLVGRGAVGVEADSGRFLWGYNRIANKVANIPTPVVRGRYVFVTTSYKTGSALVKITREGDEFHAEEVYFNGPKEFENHHGGVVLVGDHIYGGDGQNKGGPVCLDFATGEIAWKVAPPAGGSAAMLYADGNLIFRYDRGLVALVEATPEAFRLKSSFTPISGGGPAWPHPVIHQGLLYLRHRDLLAVYDLRKPE